MLKLPIFRKFGVHIIGKHKNTVNYKDSLLTGRIDFKSGEDNVVTIGKNTKFSGTLTIEGSNNVVSMGKNCIFRGEILIKGDGQTVAIGDHTTTGGGTYILCSEGCNVLIGNYCMFSRDVEIRTTDAHALIDRNTRERINPAASVNIGDHVWIGVRSVITKGAVVPTDTTIGAMSFVSGKFDEESTVLAGVPAKVIRRDITWNRGRRKKYSLKQMDAWQQ
tara:strand:+ start:4601 stop:5260 length:660 start_codon:yes stop_codon:yes gene_type:complete